MIQNNDRNEETKMIICTTTHCGKTLFFVHKFHFAVEFPIEVSDMGRCRLGKKSDEFSKNTVAPY